MSNEQETCRNCKYSADTHNTDANGNLLFRCRRYPPTIIHDETGMRLEYSAWATVVHSAWCGEWAVAE